MLGAGPSCVAVVEKEVGRAGDVYSGLGHRDWGSLAGLSVTHMFLHLE